MVNVGWGVCADSLYRQHERVGSDVFPAQGASRKPGHRATARFLKRNGRWKVSRCGDAGRGRAFSLSAVISLPHPPALTGTHRHPPHPPAPTGTHRHPPTPPSPIVILAAAGIQSPDYAPTRSLQRQYVGNCGLARRTFPVSLTVITHKMGPGFPLRRE